ncbi:MAG: SAM-dependent methyltransferase, partial [Ilumatobacteraceae bacterium]
KGGDPFVFGRGGEEAIVLAAAGISCEIVPGITSAVAGPAAAGIPVTFRGVSASFTVVTGHRQRGEIPVNWRALAQAGGTIVILMGVAERAAIAAELIAGGMARDTPVAAIHRATTDRQIVVRCRIGELAVTAVDSPAIIVIGAVAALDVTELAARCSAPDGPTVRTCDLVRC